MLKLALVPAAGDKLVLKQSIMLLATFLAFITSHAASFTAARTGVSPDMALEAAPIPAWWELPPDQSGCKKEGSTCETDSDCGHTEDHEMNCKCVSLRCKENVQNDYCNEYGSACTRDGDCGGHGCKCYEDGCQKKK